VKREESSRHPRAAAVLVLLLLAGCTRGQAATAGGFSMPPPAVTVAAAITSAVPTYIDEIGRCAAREVVTIQSQVTGPVVAIHFEDGAEVKKGDLLFTVDPRPYEAQLELAEATLAQHKAQLELGKVELERALSLVKSNAIARQEVDARRNAVAVAEAMVRSSAASLSLARINLDYCSIRSPITGRIGQRAVDAGNVVSPSSGWMVTIQRQDPVYVDFTVPERELDRVREGIARRTIRVEARAPGSKQEPRGGDLAFLDSAVQEGSGTVKLRAILANGDRRFWPGQFVNVRLILEEKDTVLVPASAPQVGQTGPYVFLLGADSKIELRPVVTGQLHGSHVALVEGVKSGEKVVVTGQLMLYPGAQAQAVEPAPAGGAK
jgi:multidrug efflux system membrane fusion protein